MKLIFSHFNIATSLLFSLFLVQTVVAQNGKILNEKAALVLESEPQKAYELLIKAQKDLSNSTDLKEAIELNISIVKRIQGKFEESIQLSNTLLKKTSNIKTKASVYNNLGAAYKRMGKNEKALNEYFVALKIYTQEKLFSGKAIVENNIGLLFQELGDFEKAKSYHQQALNYFLSVNDQLGVAKSYNMLAIVAANLGDFDGALNGFKKSYKLHKKINNKIGTSEAINNIGGIYYYMGKIDSALYYFKESLKTDRVNKDYTNLADGFNNIAEVYLNIGEYKTSRLYLDSAMVFAKHKNYANAYLIALQKIALLFEKQSDYKKSNDYLKKFYAAQDSIDKISNRKNINELEKKYQTEKKEKQLLTKEIELKKKSNLILLTTTLLVMALIIGFLIYRTLKWKNQQQKIQFLLEKERETLRNTKEIYDEKTRISRELHDNIGSQLTFMISSLENMDNTEDPTIKPKLKAMVAFGKNTMTDLRDTIWAMKAEAGTVQQLYTKIVDVKSKLSIPTVIEVNLIGNENFELNPTEMLNTYRIIQEGIQNCIKYSQAKQLKITFEASDLLQIHIQDDGIGFNTEDTPTGNGLRNMKNRAKEIGANLIIASENQKGTIIKMAIFKEK